MAKTHYFLAVPIPQELRQIYKEWIEKNKEQFPFKSWVHHEDYHITLAFLGDAPISDIGKIKNEISRVAGKHDPFQLQLSGLGYFGKQDSPRIFLGGIERQPQLEELQRDVFQTCQSIGFELEKRPYRPHVTLARRFGMESGFPASELAQFFQLDKSLLTYTVDSVVLFQTHLDRSPKYETLSTFYLKGAIT
jgi:2'-5' RNA ligase